MSNYKELKAEFDKLEPSDFCSSGVADNVKCEQTFRLWLLRLLFEIHGDMDSLAATYRELLRLQKERTK